MVSKLLKGSGLWLQVRCKSFSHGLLAASPLRRPWENDLHTYIYTVHVEAANVYVHVHTHTHTHTHTHRHTHTQTSMSLVCLMHTMCHPRVSILPW